nr:T-cell receptor V beta CDR3 region {clone V5Mz12} [mice, NOD, spleen, Peptide Partial, 16 aa] [Mus sp.]
CASSLALGVNQDTQYF